MERWNDKWDNVGDSSDDESSSHKELRADDETEDLVYAAVEKVLGEMRVEFTVLGGTAYGGSAEGDKKILSILSEAQIPVEKRPDFICHHFASWDALLWIRWQSDEAPPFHDDLYLSFPFNAGQSATSISEENKQLFKADLLTKICQLAKEKNVHSLLRQSFRLLVPNLEESFQALSPYFLGRGGKKNDYQVLTTILEAYEGGLLALQREFGEQHPAAMNGVRQLGATYAAYARQLDCILEQLQEAQRCFYSAENHFRTFLQYHGEGPENDTQRKVRYQLAAVLKCMHKKELIEEAARMYIELGEEELAEQAAEDAAAWGEYFNNDDTSGDLLSSEQM
mmetsp:Transcript_31020/g.67767  ORF Transcript_31020/g.67767 Transcript_31020/m.67767 type:complete len:338 (-) Transcript_31020:302-1315(-)|eukprot:CAMPEP_0118945384 /NCGR_PEP_ID=MMETSP1169-20130426/42144_1 /TAXON_ID=36882 /ORGANISM="Pyramimonas obovata, Strain CCMP722" /LENGTH=337 /DNA_ID=CAMNT_0006891085 /DNA_START=209 /DNA_END=1222 /DNA_ORIENTATION=-